MQDNSGNIKIEYNNVCKKFSNIEVVQDVSFKINEGDFVSFVGPSGCGKTTMMNILAGFESVTSGEVLLEGQEVTQPGPERGVIFQDYGVFPWLTVEKNIRFGFDLGVNKHIRESEKVKIIEKYIHLMNLQEFRNAWPKNLSGGMRQRLALARAYAVNPKYLLMDEPFGALDAQTRSDMHELLLSIMGAERKTIILITHSVDEAIYLSSRILIISARPARIVADVLIPFPFPRDKSLLDSEEFVLLRKRLRDAVMAQYAKQIALNTGSG